MAKGDDRCTVGASGKPQEGMDVRNTGAKVVAEVMRRADGTFKASNPGGGMKFNFRDPSGKR